MEICDIFTRKFIRIAPMRYQYQVPVGDPHDDNWLMIRGQVQSHDEAWVFEDPALLVGEAHGIAIWLRAAAEGRLTPLAADDCGCTQPDTDTIEPNIGFGLVAFSLPLITLRMFLNAKSAPPSQQPSLPWEYYFDLTMTPSALLRAADEWTDELADFHLR